jgi:hypothetical protein
MLPELVMYDQTLTLHYAPVLQMEEPVVPLQVCVARSASEYDNGCYYPLIMGVHFALAGCKAIHVYEHPNSAVCNMLGLTDEYVIVVKNDEVYGDMYD